MLSIRSWNYFGRFYTTLNTNVSKRKQTINLVGLYTSHSRQEFWKYLYNKIISTQRKMSNNYTSPYDKPVQQYPSQSEDYISLDMGGLSQPKNAGSNEKSPGGYLNTSYFQNSNSKSNRGKNLFNNSGNRYNRSNQYNQQDRYTPRKNNDHQQQERYTPRKNNDRQQQERYTPRKNDYQQQRYTPRKNSESYQNKNQHVANPASPSISAYCHPTMTEDPWTELLDRIHAIERSTISIKNTSAQNETTQAVESATPDSDNSDDVGGDSVSIE